MTIAGMTMQPSISPGRWRQLEPIFDQALDLTGDARAAYLDEACTTDHALRAEIEALLRADQDSDDFLEGSLESLFGHSPLNRGSDTGLDPETTIGPYRVV